MELFHEDSKMIQRAVEAFNKGEFLNEFIPVPKELKDTPAAFGSMAESPKFAANKEKYGYTNWYDFCVNEWGTKWDVGGDDFKVELVEGDKNVTLCFDSAYAPPTNAYEKLTDLGFKVTGYYDECGMAFCGIWESEFGDDYYEYGGMDSAEAEFMLPSELNEMFGISETIAEYEAEEEAEDEENESEQENG